MIFMRSAQNSFSSVLKAEPGQKTLGFRLGVPETAEVSHVAWSTGKQLESQRAMFLCLLQSATAVAMENSAGVIILCI